MIEAMVERIGYSLKEVAEQLSVSVPFLRKEIKRGELIPTPLGDRQVILKADRDDYIRRQREKWLARRKKSEEDSGN